MGQEFHNKRYCVGGSLSAPQCCSGWIPWAFSVWRLLFFCSYFFDNFLPSALFFSIFLEVILGVYWSFWISSLIFFFCSCFWRDILNFYFPSFYLIFKGCAVKIVIPISLCVCRCVGVCYCSFFITS